MTKTKIIDLHCDTIGEIQAGIDIEKSQPELHIDIPRMQSGDVGCQVFACFVSSMVPEVYAFNEAIKLLELTEEICQKYAGYFDKVNSADEIEKTIQKEKIAILPAVENGHVIANDLKNLEILRALGACYMTLTHMKNLDWAASSGESECDFKGLTQFGEKVVHAMNEMGMIIDISHVHESTFWATQKLSKSPLIASHSNASAICPAARNLTDDQIKAIAESGGMVGINFYPGFLESTYLQKNIERCRELFITFDTLEEKYLSDPVRRMQALRELGKEFRKRMNDIHVGFEKIIDHISYIVDLVGEDYVGFGSDFDGLPALPDGMTGCDIYTSLVRLLKKKGYQDDRIYKICAGNFLRVLAEHD
jgi:membrane dipeptidase